MASYQETIISVPGAPGVIHHVTWTLTDSDYTGDPYVFNAQFLNHCLHVYGTFGGGTVTLKGSNEKGTPANGVTLNSTTMAPISLTAAALVNVLQTPLKVWPELAPSGTASVTVDLVFMS